jgi:hypothetical protein
MSWLEAVKAHSKQTGKWLVPKKGTAEYEAVKKIQADMEKKAAEPVVEPVSTKKPRINVAEARAKKIAETPLPVPAPIKLTKAKEIAQLREETAKLKAELEAKNAVSIPVAKKKEPVKAVAELSEKSKLEAKERKAEKVAKKAKAEEVKKMTTAEKKALKKAEKIPKMEILNTPVVLDFS